MKDETKVTITSLDVQQMLLGIEDLTTGLENIVCYHTLDQQLNKKTFRNSHLVDEGLNARDFMINNYDILSGSVKLIKYCSIICADAFEGLMHEDAEGKEGKTA